MLMGIKEVRFENRRAACWRVMISRCSIGSINILIFDALIRGWEVSILVVSDTCNDTHTLTHSKRVDRSAVSATRDRRAFRERARERAREVPRSVCEDHERIDVRL